MVKNAILFTFIDTLKTKYEKGGAIWTLFGMFL